MAELVDALASGASELRFVEVQVLLSPPNQSNLNFFITTQLVNFSKK